MLVEKQVENASTLVLFKLNSLDWEPIAYKLMYPESGKGWTKEQAARAIARYIMFLSLKYLHPHAKIVPTQEIDRVWHTHILDTCKYAEDCDKVFGYFLHHFPYFGLRGEEDQQNLQGSFAQTQSLFQEHFNISFELSKPSICILQGDGNQSRPRVEIDLDPFLPLEV